MNKLQFVIISILCFVKIESFLIDLNLKLNKKSVDDQNEINKIFENKTEIDENVLPRHLFVQIKSTKLENANKPIEELYAIESQNDFYIECQINSQITSEPLIYWWFKSYSSNVTKLLKKPLTKRTKRDASLSGDVNQANNKLTIVSRIYIDCPNYENEGEYFCAALDKNVYHKTKVKLSILAPNRNARHAKKSCDVAPYKMFGPNPARIIEYTLVIFNYEHENVLLKCRTQSWRIKHVGLKQNPKYANKKLKKRDLDSFLSTIGHIWLDNHNKQIKETNSFFKLLDNGDLIIRNLTYENHFGQFACITRRGNKIDSVSTFVFPIKNDK